MVDMEEEVEDLEDSVVVMDGDMDIEDGPSTFRRYLSKLMMKCIYIKIKFLNY